jgi:hypothetical protein
LLVSLFDLGVFLQLCFAFAMTASKDIRNVYKKIILSVCGGGGTKVSTL